MDYEIPAEVSPNPTFVQFPTDPEGMFSKLIKEGLAAAQKVYCKDQLDLLMAVYAILVKHSRAFAERQFSDIAKDVADAKAREQAAAGLVQAPLPGLSGN